MHRAIAGITCAWIAASGAAVSAQAVATLDRVVAVVNGDMITLSDVRAVRALRLVAEADEQAIVRALVDRRLVAAELRRFQVPDPDRESVAARVREWERAAPGAAAVARLLALAGVEAWFVERWMADDIRRERYLEQRFAALTPERRAEAVRQWFEGLRARADVVYRLQRF